MSILNRFIHSDNGVLKDFSVDLDNPLSATQAITFVAAEDKLFISGDLPFNHRYFLISSVNANPSVVSIRYWSGNKFESAVDVIDETKTGTTSLAKSGHINFTPDKDKPSWLFDHTDEMTDSGLESVNIENQLWSEWSWSADVTVTLKYVGEKFSNDEDLRPKFPDLLRQKVFDAFDPTPGNKTDWDEQHIIAAKDVIRDLKNNKIIVSRDQILDWRSLKQITTLKVAELIYWGLGSRYDKDRLKARVAYKEELKLDVFRTDRDLDGRLDRSEMFARQGFMTR